VIRVGYRRGEGVAENSAGFLKRNAVVSLVCRVFVRIPREPHRELPISLIQRGLTFAMTGAVKHAALNRARVKQVVATKG
jgi:hypothetical protein